MRGMQQGSLRLQTLDDLAACGKRLSICICKHALAVQEVLAEWDTRSAAGQPVPSSQ
jgi:hypothetical protein